MSSEQKGHFLLFWLEAAFVLGRSRARLADIPLPIPATTRPGNTKSSTLARARGIAWEYRAGMNKNTLYKQGFFIVRFDAGA